jgi:choline-sulfatase
MKYWILLGLWALAIPSAWAADRPNIVFFFADDQTTSSLGCYGHPFVESPHIDALAARGVRFDNALVSQPICWVSRTNILTGVAGRSYGRPGNPEQTRADIAETLFSDLLRDSGYRVGFFGKWHAKMPPGYAPHEHFDVFEAISRDPYYKTQPDGSLRHETDLIADRGIEFLEQQAKDQPFVLNLWFNACHAEDGDRRPGLHFAWPEASNGLYDRVAMPQPRLSERAIFDALPDCLQTSIARERYFWRWNTPAKYETNMRAYFRMVSGIDAALGRVIQTLQRTGLADNTIVVYSADNGYHMANRGLAGKWSHFEESLRVPLIIADLRSDPAQGGIVTAAPVLNLDLPATFLDWAGVEIPPHYQGRSLQPIVAGEVPTDWRRETFHEHFAVRARIPAWEGIRTPRFKYARYFDHNYEFLHDLQHDPDELVNLVDDPEHAAVLQTLRQRTAATVDELGGPLPPPSTPFRASTVPHPVAAAAVTVKPDAAGWVQLFNGRDLSGWEGDRRFWSVEQGVLTGKTDGTLPRNSFLTWLGATVRNFDLRVKVLAHISHRPSAARP